ncbi:MAG: Uma2 family endonuclease [Cellulosilyticaceae bacterium]
MSQMQHTDAKDEMIAGQEYYLSTLSEMSHSLIINRLHAIIGYKLLRSPCDVHTDNVYLRVSEDTKIIPDLMITCDKRNNKKDGYYGVPKFVVEVLSPSPKAIYRDRVEKMEIYRKLGVEEYWIIDYRSKVIEMYALIEGSYALKEVHTHGDEAEEQDDQATLMTFPNITVELKDIFD